MKNRRVATYLYENIQKAVNSLYKEAIEKKGDDYLTLIDLVTPKEFSFGDYTSSLPLKLSKIIGENPMMIAEDITKELKKEGDSKLKDNGIEKIEIVKPGFINFFVTTELLITQLNTLLTKPSDFSKSEVSVKNLEMFLKKQSKDIKLYQEEDKTHGKIRVVFEFGHANTHKEMHIGHLRNLVIGESIIRLLTNLGIEVVRVNYEGDVGMHIAKCLWGVLHTEGFTLNSYSKKSIIEKVEFLGKAYVKGNKAYEESEESKKEIIEINRKIYSKDEEIAVLWNETRKWSLEYFESIYKRVGTHFQRYYFESEVFEPGKKIVEDNIGKVFEKSENAVIFPGEKYGLHNRVFITQEGFATYEGKEMGLGKLQFDEYNPTLIIHNVGPEQAEYFKVVFKALGIIFPQTQGKELHHVYGWVQLKDGKMSSRMGNVVSARWLLDEAYKKAETLITKEEYKEGEKREISEKVAVGSVKYSFLRFSSKSDISFNFDESISLEGDSGPYIMYTFARCESVKNKANQHNSQTISNYNNINQEELLLLRLINKFPEVLFEAAVNFAPNVLTHYLYTLSQAYNFFYTKHKIINSGKEVTEFRLALNQAVGQALQKGLSLLGIDTVSKM